MRYLFCTKTYAKNINSGISVYLFIYQRATPFLRTHFYPKTVGGGDGNVALIAIPFERFLKYWTDFMQNVILQDIWNPEATPRLFPDQF